VNKPTIAVIGANGRSGAAFVQAALDAGYVIRAGVHSKASLPAAQNLTIVPTDATKPEDVDRLLENCTIVVSLIGHIKGSPKRVQTQAMEVIVEMMNQRKIRRLVSLTGSGARLAGDTPSLADLVLNIPLKLIDPNRINDGIEHLEVLQDSSLDWTVIRVLKLTSGKAGPFSLTPHGPAKLFTSRHEVANAILQVISDNSYIHQAPIISRHI
jgi:putative NADH-flavin reductase